MDCTQCEPVLLDLCYGELEPAQEREVRVHVHECPECRKALSRIEAGQALARHLPDEAPSPEMTERILRAAQSHLRKRGTPFERFQGFLESMARIAMTRQVAMATMSLLIVFVGLWAIPELTHRRQEHGAMVVDTSHEGEAGPSSSVQPQAPPEPVAQAPSVEPVANTQSLEARKQATGDDAERDVGRSSASRATTSKRIGAGPRESATANAVAARQKAKAERKGNRFAPPPPAAAPKEESVEAELLARKSAGDSTLLDDSAYGGTSSGRAEQKAPPSAAATADSLDALGAVPLAESMPSAAPPARPAAPTPTTLEQVYAAGVERYRANDFAAAAKLFSQMLESSSPSAQRPAALLYLARSERALGRCDRALRAYETLVRSYGSAQQSVTALSEGVACYDQLGDKAGAQRFLEHAISVPSLAPQATKLREERGGAKPAEPPAPAAAPASRP